MNSFNGKLRNYFNKKINRIAGMVEMSNQMQPQIHSINAIVDRIGDSHSKQLLLSESQIDYYINR